jgi:very-short-patch-repair endonuclease
MSRNTRGETTLQTVLSARALRRQMTPTEKTLWNALRNGRLDGIKFRRQHPYGPFVLDFFCVEHQLVIEVDGSVHQQAEQRSRDTARDEYLEQHGLRVLRVRAEEVERDLPGVLSRIREACLTPPPDPLPSPDLRSGEGRGWRRSRRGRGEAQGRGEALLALSLALGLIFALSALAAPEEEGARSPAAGPAASAPGDTHTIYQIQYTTNPGSGNTYPSPVAGQVVTTSGTVCAVYKRGYVINEDTGPWHGVYVYVGPSGAKPAQGTLVQVTGAITEYQGMTEFSYPTRVRQMGEGPNVCTPTVIAAAAVPYNNPALAEPYEGTIVEYRNITITSIGTYSALFVDGSGGTGAIFRGSSDVYVPDLSVGQRYEYVRGVLLPYYASEYRVWLASPDDIRPLDLTPPTVTATDPLSGATSVNPHRPIRATFSEPVSPTTVTTASFRVQGPSGPVTGTVAYDPATSQATFTPEGPLAPNALHTATLTADIRDRVGNPLVPYTWTFTTGPLDTDPPTVVGRTPAPEATDVPLNADVVITFSEELKPDTVVAANFTLTGPYGAVPWENVTCDPAAYRVTLNPRGLLLPTARYTLTIGTGLTDWAGNPVAEADRTWAFTTQAEPPMHVYHGDLHNHTSYSDGSLTPYDAFTRAVAAGLDFLAVTDHSYAIDDAEWADTLTRANAFTRDGAFVALRGFEYTQGAEGHINVYNTVRHATRSQVAGCNYCDYTPNLEPGVTVEGFYRWLAVTGTQAVDDAGVVMQFNHPGWINFNDWAYHPEVEDLAELEEVGNGWGASYVFSWDEWVRSLDYGWKVGATNNSDNHTPDWGTITDHRTGVVMPALTKRDLLDALRARRTFATEDKNAALYFRANGYWMGSEIPNTGEILFEVHGDDPDGEPTARVELVTAQGRVVTYTQPGAASYTWTFSLDISPGVHYYFVQATQADGDRLVASPVWTLGDEDLRITDLTVQPAIPTIYNPSLFTARVTNRGPETRTVTVTFTANGTPIGEIPVTVPACSRGPCPDAYAQVTYQAGAAGPLTVTAALVGAPAADNPDDNARSLSLTVTDEKVPLVLIDAGHNNIGVDPRGSRAFVNDLVAHGYNVLFNLDELTATDLNTEVVKLLILNAYGPNPLTVTETQAIADFVAAGGNLWLNGMSDYTGKVWWAYSVADRMNDLIAAIEARAGVTVPVRFNDDEVLDGNDNNGYPWGIQWHIFPVSPTTGVGMNVLRIQSWSVASLVDRNRQALTAEDLGANGHLFVIGDLDSGSGTYGYPNRTHNTDADGEGDAYIYGPTERVPAAAGYDLPGPAGRLFFYGDSNDPFNIFAYAAGDGRQNELFNLETVMWLLGEPLQKKTIAQARYDPEEDDTPVNLHKLVWVEGFVTASYGEFFDVLYVQDDTGGITVFAPAGTASGAVEAMPVRGDCVRVVGTVDVYQGDTEIQFFESEQVQVLTPTCVPSPTLAVTGSVPLPLRTVSATLEAYEGWLAVVSGTVTAVSADRSGLWVDDGSGPVRAFLDGYNGTWEGIQVLDRVIVAGLVSEDYDGPRLRVRNYRMHPDRPDDLVVLSRARRVYLPLVLRAAQP